MIFGVGFVLFFFSVVCLMLGGRDLAPKATGAFVLVFLFGMLCMLVSAAIKIAQVMP